MVSKYEIEKLRNICNKLDGEIELKKDFFKQFTEFINFMNKKSNTIYYFYNNKYELLLSNGKNKRLLNKDDAELQEEGYDRFILKYHQDDLRILYLRKRLVETGESFETPVRYKTILNEFESFLVYNCLLNPDAKPDDQIFMGEAISLKSHNIFTKVNKVQSTLISKVRFGEIFSMFKANRLDILWLMYNKIEPNKEIAYKVTLSESGVKANLRNIYKYFKIHERAELMKVILEKIQLAG